MRVRLWVRKLSSSASTKPIRVPAKAVSFRWRGMVIGGTVTGGAVGDDEPGEQASDQ